MAVAYAKLRQQFGRPIGSFQAIKHRCADLLLEVESLRSAVSYAAAAVAAGSTEVPVLAPLLKAYASEVYSHVAGENIQIHGGIGFTWEHDAHLYLKRAKASELFLGDGSYHRERLAARIGLLPARPSPHGVLCKKFALCNEPALVADRSPAPAARAGPKGLHSRAGFA
jgi:alkylation response protein AidB-like acyl-CoA dehydrogenase